MGCSSGSSRDGTWKGHCHLEVRAGTSKYICCRRTTKVLRHPTSSSIKPSINTPTKSASPPPPPKTPARPPSAPSVPSSPPNLNPPPAPTTPSASPSVPSQTYAPRPGPTANSAETSSAASGCTSPSRRRTRIPWRSCTTWRRS